MILKLLPEGREGEEESQPRAPGLAPGQHSGRSAAGVDVGSVFQARPLTDSFQETMEQAPTESDAGPRILLQGTEGRGLAACAAADRCDTGCHTQLCQLLPRNPVYYLRLISPQSPTKVSHFRVTVACLLRGSHPAVSVHPSPNLLWGPCS